MICLSRTPTWVAIGALALSSTCFGTKDDPAIEQRDPCKAFDRLAHSDGHVAPDLGKYQWPTNVSRPSPLLWRLTFGSGQPTIPEGVRLVPATFPLLQHIHAAHEKSGLIAHSPIRLEANKYYFLPNDPRVEVLGVKRQRVEASTEYEKGLLSAASLDSNPHEVHQYRLADEHKSVESELVHGTDSDLEHPDWQGASALTIKQATQAGVLSKELVITHVHPRVEVVGDFMHLSCLGDADILSAWKHSLRYPEYLVTMKAVTPGEITYSVSFKNGEQVFP